MREEELSALEARLLTDRIHLTSDETIVKALVLKIDYAKRRLAAQERYLTDLLELMEQWHLVDGSHEQVELVPDEIICQQQEIAILASKIDEMMEELHAKRMVCNISRIHLAGLETHRQRLLDALKGLKAAFAPVHAVPAEVWIIIFRHRIEGDVESHRESFGADSICNTPLILAHVSSYWRKVVTSEKSLWRYFIYSAQNGDGDFQAERWKQISSFNHSSLTLVTSLNEKIHAKIANVDGLSPSSMHLLVKYPDKSRISTIPPFGSLESLTVEMAPSSFHFINSVYKHYPAFTSLTIICPKPFCRPSMQLYGPIRPTQSLKFLKMDLTAFTDISVEEYGPVGNLEQLHVLQDGISYLKRSYAAKPTYLKLQILGLTPPDTDGPWIKDISLPSLKQLILYGPKSLTVGQPSLLGLAQHNDFHRIKELEFRNWPMYNPKGTPQWSIVPLILSIADHLRLVEIIRCVDSFIEGESLVTLVNLLINRNGNQTPSSLNKVIVDCCTGITRSDCEQIAEVLEKLVVQV
jgi:hypothetical protein